MKPQIHVQFRIVWAVVCLLSLLSCSKSQRSIPPDGKIILTAWAHAGRQAERDILSDQVDQFNRSRDDVRIDLTFLPEGTYNSQVQAAALSDDLPDLLEFDGPFVYNYVWQNRLQPLDTLLSPETIRNLLPSMQKQGTTRGALWAVGQYDSGLGLWADKEALEAVGARIPAHPSDAWSVQEFEAILERLAAQDPDGQVLDLKLNYRGEWFTYAFSPALRSAGGGLIARPDYDTAEGVLDSPESVATLSRFHRWRASGRVDPNTDDNAFAGGRVALSWVGHWQYEGYHNALGDRLILLPLPDFGNGSRTGQGSWTWGMTRTCPAPEAAADFLEFLLEDEQILEMTSANGAVPATRSASQASPLFRKSGPLHLFVVQLEEGYSVPRPRTPAYPVITSVFQAAFQDILDGADPQTTLQRSAAEITQDIRDNQGYPNVPFEEASP